MHTSSVSVDGPHDLSEWESHSSSWGAAGYCVLFLKRAYILGGVNLENSQSHLFPESRTFSALWPKS